MSKKIYILKSNTRDGKKEYRVAECSAIENIYEPEDDYYGFNEEMLNSYFGRCSVYSSEIEAYKVAEQMASEYGIQEIELKAIFPK